jgi:glucosylceramidase
MRRMTVASAGCLALAGALAFPSFCLAQTVSVYVTTDDRKVTLHKQADVSFGAPVADVATIDVDEARVYQPIEGFGASFTDASAYLLNQVAKPAARDAVMKALFTREGDGIGLGFIRNPMGGTDLARTHYSYDDLPAGLTDPTLARFSIAHDEADIIPLTKRARELNPRLVIMATPWSPPAWVKTARRLVGGALLPALYDAFAAYFVKYINAYQAAGIHIDYISLQNEPLFVPGDYPGMSLDAATATVVIRDHILPAFAAAKLSTRVLVYDHNWDRPDYPQAVLADPVIAASPIVAGTAWHGYGGGPGAMLALDNGFPQRGNYQTEHSGGTWVTNQVKEDFEEIIHVMRSSGRAFVKWGIALDDARGPHRGGCDTCAPLVTVHNNGEVTRAIEFYTLGHFSRFVLPDARRIYTSNAAGLISAGFLNADGSKAVVVYNEARDSRTFQVRAGSTAVRYTLPGLAGATFTWTGVPSGSYSADARAELRASSFSSVSGLQTEACTDTLGGFDLGFADDGDYAAFEKIDFGTGVSSVDVRMASAASTAGTLELRLDSVSGPLMATIKVPLTGGWQKWATVSAPVGAVSGVHTVYTMFRGGNGIGNLNWLKFN